MALYALVGKREISAGVKKISQQEQVEKLHDIDIGDEALARYFVEDKGGGSDKDRPVTS